MQRYSKFRPTSFDRSGLGCRDEQEWFVAPCSRNRDSGTLTESNWQVQLRELEAIDPDGNDHQVHSFGHWACGWFELVLVRPDSKCFELAEGLEGALSDYPILCEMHWSELELEMHDDGQCDEHCSLCEYDREAS